MELQWPLIIFTTLLAWSCGVFATQGVLALKGEGKEIQLPALITSVVLLAVSGIAVFFHLQHWERIFNGFGSSCSWSRRSSTSPCCARAMTAAPCPRGWPSSRSPSLSCSPSCRRTAT